MGIFRVRRPSPIPGVALRRHPLAPGRPPASPSPSVCRARLGIGYHVTSHRLQTQVELAYRTAHTQVLTTILWGGRIDDVSRRRLTDALSLAAHGGCFVRLPAFAAAARDLFRHASTAWAARHRHRVRPRCVAHPSRHPHAPDRIPAASPLHGDPLAAARHLCNLTRLRPHVTIVHGPEADHSVQTALSALQELSDSIADYLQQALQPLAPSIGRHAVHAFILETRREPRDLAACHSPGNAYVETLTLSEPRPNAVSLEVQGSIGGAVG